MLPLPFGPGDLTVQRKFQILSTMFWHFFLLSLSTFMMLGLVVILLAIQLYQKLQQMKRLYTNSKKFTL